MVFTIACYLMALPAYIYIVYYDSIYISIVPNTLLVIRFHFLLNGLTSDSFVNKNGAVAGE